MTRQLWHDLSGFYLFRIRRTIVNRGYIYVKMEIVTTCYSLFLINCELGELFCPTTLARLSSPTGTCFHTMNGVMT